LRRIYKFFYPYKYLLFKKKTGMAREGDGRFEGVETLKMRIF